MQSRDQKTLLSKLMPAATQQQGADLVQQFALRVMKELARSVGTVAEKMDEDFLRLLVRMAQTGDSKLLAQLHAEMLRKRISPEHVIDRYFPSAIGIIGTAWHEAEIDILSATIAISRLQVLLRDFGRAWVADRADGHDKGRVLLILPAGEQHSLGALVAANRLRRMGVSVKIGILDHDRQIDALLDGRDYHGIMFSLSNDTSLPSCTDLIRAIRRATGASVPIVVGGGLVCRAARANKAQRIAGLTAADLATSDVREAVTACGLGRMTIAAE